MATVAETPSFSELRPDLLSGTPRAHAIDRRIFVIMAAWFIAIVLAGFIPDSLMKIGLVQTGQRLPFPPILHVHAVLMGSFLLLLLTQSVLMATGNSAQHMRLGMVAMVLAPALVIAGFIVAPAMYHMLRDAAQSAPAGKRADLQNQLNIRENILLLQIRIGLLFAAFITIGLKARGHDVGLHKRMMFLATAMTLPAAFDRMFWLPNTTQAWKSFAEASAHLAG